jgi:hypothetical protein
MKKYHNDPARRNIKVQDVLLAATVIFGLAFVLVVMIFA